MKKTAQNSRLPNSINDGWKVRIAVRVIRESGWTYELRWVQGDKEMRQSLSSQDIDLARATRSRIERAVWEYATRKPKFTAHGVSYDTLIGVVLADMVSRGLFPRSIASTKERLLLFQKRTGITNAKEITSGVVQEYFASERKRGRAPGGLSTDYRHLHAAFKAALRLDLLESDPFAGLSPVRVPRRIHRRFSKEQFASLYSLIADFDDQLLVVLLVSTGMRINEALSLEWKDVDLLGRRILVEGKGGHEREIPVSDLLAAFLAATKRLSQRVLPGDRALIREGKVRADSTISWSRLHKRFARYRNGIGIPAGEGMFHRFRHTTASALADMRANYLEIRLYLGHADSTVTDGYIALGRDRFHELAKLLEEWLLSCGVVHPRPQEHLTS